MASLVAADISKTYVRSPVLQNVNLSVRPTSIHCLAGANGSGKSTLIKIIAGTLPPDSGTVELDGHDVTRLNPLARINFGLSVIYQDFALLPNLSVFENITFLDSVSRHRKWVNFRLLHREAAEILARMKVQIPLDALVEDLPVANQQLVAIARALKNRSKVIIMDEPTSALTNREVKTLFQIVNSVRSTGVSFILVTHKLEEIYEICDEVTVIRNGEVVNHGPITDFTTAQLSEAISGRQIRIERLQPPEPPPETAPLLEVISLTGVPAFSDVSFTVKPGEIVGLTGLLGSGRTELALTLAGKSKPSSGSIKLAGENISLRNVRDAQRHGIGYIPEDRLSEGLFLEQEIFDNMLIANLKRRLSFGLLDKEALRRDGTDWIKRLDIKPQHGRDPVQTLSGGNQQRVLIARYLDLNPKLLILNGPTMGVDVGSKHDIHLLIAELAKAGTGILVVSDDLPELLSISHRILVMTSGKLSKQHSAQGLDLQTLSREVTLE
ncbi:MAG TPA: sugar ABC transporter ATP-binding protein [Chthoniobacterales bacterium]